MPLPAFKAVQITVKADDGSEETWTVERYPRPMADTYVFRPFPAPMSPGRRLVPGPHTTYWSDADWERWFATYDKRHAEWMAWFDRCVWLHTDDADDLAQLVKWGLV